jgi:flagellar motor protein MotB
MLGNRYSKKPRSKDEGEKPFWISFADLMTALMTLFLVVMAVSLWS